MPSLSFTPCHCYVSAVGLDARHAYGRPITLAGGGRFPRTSPAPRADHHVFLCFAASGRRLGDYAALCHFARLDLQLPSSRAGRGQHLLERRRHTRLNLALSTGLPLRHVCASRKEADSRSLGPGWPSLCSLLSISV